MMLICKLWKNNNCPCCASPWQQFRMSSSVLTLKWQATFDTAVQELVGWLQQAETQSFQHSLLPSNPGFLASSPSWLPRHNSSSHAMTQDQIGWTTFSLAWYAHSGLTNRSVSPINLLLPFSFYMAKLPNLPTPCILPFHVDLPTKPSTIVCSLLGSFFWRHLRYPGPWPNLSWPWFPFSQRLTLLNGSPESKSSSSPLGKMNTGLWQSSRPVT